MDPGELSSGPGGNFDTICDVTTWDIIKLGQQLGNDTRSHQPVRQVIAIQTRTANYRREVLISENAIIDRLISAAQLLAPVMRRIEDEVVRLSLAPAMFLMKAIPFIDLTDSHASSMLQRAPTTGISTSDILEPSNLVEATSVRPNPVPARTRHLSDSRSNVEASIPNHVMYEHLEHLDHDYYEHIDTIPNTPVSTSGSAAGDNVQEDVVHSRGQYVQQRRMLEPSIPQKRKRERTEYSTESAPVERSTVCRICYNRDLDTCLFSCGHVCWGECAEKIDRCPTCREEIKERVKVFAVLSY
jgi:hypothetical protein